MKPLSTILSNSISSVTTSLTFKLPLAIKSIVCWNVVPTPATSNDTSIPFSVLSYTACTGSTLSELKVCVAPTLLAFSKRSSDKSKTKILLAPAVFAAITVSRPIGSAPKTATVSPNNNSPSFTA